jgi:hypothetical protein
MLARNSDSAIALALLIFCSATVWAEEAPRHEPTKVAAVVTDVPPVTPTPAEVAREVIRLQEEMGGSITAAFGELAPQAPPQPVPPQHYPYYVPGQKSPVATLREVAWQLEQSAHLLESLDLYDQADAVRNTATRLRLDARAMKANPLSTKTAQPNVTSHQD